MILQKFTTGPIRTHTYLIIDGETHKAAVIDPGGESSDKIIDALEKHKADLVYIINTHVHPDHIAENALLKDMTGAKIAAYKEGLKNFSRNWNAYMQKHGVKVLGGYPDELLDDKQEVKTGGIVFQVLHTPGHTADSICLYLPQENIIFSGDTIFAGGLWGRTDLEGSNKDFMQKSLKRILKLPSQTLIYPGHGKDSSIEKERPFYSIF